MAESGTSDPALSVMADATRAVPLAAAIIENRPGDKRSTVALVAAGAPKSDTDEKDKAAATEPLEGVALVSAALYGCAVTALWIVIFAIGATVNSQPFRDVLSRFATESVGGAVFAAAPAEGAAGPMAAALGPSPTFGQAVMSLGVVAVSYTPTNLAVLCACAALIGCLGQIATVTRKAARATPDIRLSTHTGATSAATAAPDAPTLPHPPSPIDVTLRTSIGAVTWGFFVYLVVTSGTIVFTGDPFQNTSPEQYIRLAGAASLLAFVVGWRPELLGDLLTKVSASRIGGASK